MVDDKGSHFQAAFPDIFADYQNPPLTRDVAVANKAWLQWQIRPLRKTLTSGLGLDDMSLACPAVVQLLVFIYSGIQ